MTPTRLKTNTFGVILHISAGIAFFAGFVASMAGSVIGASSSILSAIFFEVTALHCRNYVGKNEE